MEANEKEVFSFFRWIETLTENFELHEVEANELFFSFTFYSIFQCSIVVDATLKTFFFFWWRFLIRCLPFLTVLMYAIVDDDCFEYWTEEKREEKNAMIKNNWSSLLRLLISFHPSTFTVMWFMCCYVYGQKRNFTIAGCDFFRASFLQLV